MVRRRLRQGGEERTKQDAPSITIPHDAANEAIIVAAAALDPELLAQLMRRLRPDLFHVRENAEAWQVLSEMHRHKLRYDGAVVEKLAGREVADYLAVLVEARPRPPANLEWHVTTLLWDNARVTAARGPVPAFLEALRDPKSEPERVRSLSRQIGGAFDGHEIRKYLHDQVGIVREQMGEIERRATGQANYPFGIDGLDYFEDPDDQGRRRKRVVFGAAPGMITLVTSVSGAGKTTTTANIVLGLLRMGRRVLYGSWEMNGGMTLELLACISLGWSRSELGEGIGPAATHEGRVLLEEKMHEVSRGVRFMGNPFRRRVSGRRATNDDHLDLVQGYIADAGCDVFVADLWKRCLVDVEPDAEEDAMIRQQAMAEEERVHCILLQQQRLKDIEQRPDKRPTREGIKGSSAYVEVPDTIIGVHRPALWKRIEDDKLEVFLLKQRQAKAPLAVEFDWDADRGMISGGRSVEYARPGEENEVDGSLQSFFARPRDPRKKFGR
jgi:hypothetical protein